MKFVLIDTITALEPGKSISATKSVTLAEEYLADHFPTFPVLPGVLMLEAATQAAAWLVRDHLDFAVDLVLLKAARNVTYKSFVAPGQTLSVQADCTAFSAEQSAFTVAGWVADRATLKGKLVLRHVNLTDLDPALADTSAQLRQQQRDLFHRLHTTQPARTPEAPANT